jgi:LacI family transcriptional regulator
MSGDEPRSPVRWRARAMLAPATMQAATPDRARSVTLKDVAKVAGVHVSTASRALDPTKSRRISPGTIARVTRAAEQLGYTPDVIAKGLKRGTTMMVGVVLPDLSNPIWATLIRGIGQQVESRGLVTVVTETLEDHDRLERALNSLSARRVDAVIVAAARNTDRYLLAEFARRFPAFVLAIRNVGSSGLPHITQDDRHGGELAAEHLIELGHKVVAQLRGPIDIELFEERNEGFRRAAGAGGMVEVTTGESADEVTLAEGRRLMKRTLDQNPANPPTAVFAHADVMAIGAIEELEARGLRCPGDISIVGYDDAPLVSHVSPPLSTVRIPGDEIGRLAGEAVLKLIDSPSEPYAVSIPAELIVRDSTAAPQPVGR